MKFKKIVAVAAVVALLGLIFALPVVRDELAWYWTESRDQAADYQQYLTDWPKGHHGQEARLRYEQRTRKDSTRAMINDALKKSSSAQSDAPARQERQQRIERFLWKQVSTDDTILSYHTYLQRYPSGEFSTPARRRLQELYSQPTPASTNANPLH